MDLDSHTAEYKVVIMGDSSIGKTSIVQRFNQETFDYQMDTTIGASFLSKIMQTKSGPITLNVWDTAGQERYRSLIPTYARGANAAIICFDLTCQKSFDSLEKWINDLHQFCSEEVPIYIVGNKCDLEPVVNEEEAKTFAANRGVLYFRTSAKTGMNVMELFQAIADELSSGDEGTEEIGVDLNKNTDKEKSGCC